MFFTLLSMLCLHLDKRCALFIQEDNEACASLRYNLTYTPHEYLTLASGCLYELGVSSVG